MSKLILALSFATLLFVLAPSKAWANWAVGADFGLGFYNAHSDRAPAESGYLALIGASLTFPIGFYARLDRIFSDSDNVMDAIITSYGWSFDISGGYNITAAFGTGTATLYKDRPSYQRKLDSDLGLSQIFVSAGYRTTNKVQLTLGLHILDSDDEIRRKNLANTSSIPDGLSLSGKLLSAGIIYYY